MSELIGPGVQEMQRLQREQEIEERMREHMEKLGRTATLDMPTVADGVPDPLTQSERRYVERYERKYGVPDPVEEAARRHLARSTENNVDILGDIQSSAPHTLLIGDERDAYEAFRVAAAELGAVQARCQAELGAAQDKYRQALARLSNEATKKV